MKKTIISLVFAALLIPGTLFAQTAVPKPLAAARPEYKVPFVNKTLPNGLEIIVYPDKGVPIVTVELDVRNGSFTEPPELNGLSHLYEHMFFKTNSANRILQCEMAQKQGGLNEYGRRVCGGALSLKPKIGDVSYLSEVGQMGINYNGSTREEVVNYYFTTTSQNISAAIRIIRNATLFPEFDENEFAREKEVVIGEIDRNESNPFYYLNRTLQDKLFYKYPTRKNPLGSRESIQSATTEKMRLIRDRYYVPNNSAIVVTGDVDANEVFKLVEKEFGEWERRKVDPFKEFPLVEHPPLANSEGHIVEQPVQNVLIQIGWHGPSIGKDNAATYAADVFSYIISQPDSRFQRNLVDSGLAVAADFGYYTQRNVGPIVLSLVTTPEKAKAALKAVHAEIAQFDKLDYFSDTELENAKTRLESRDLFEREKLTEYVHTLGFWWSSTGIEYFRGYHQELRSVTRNDTNRYIKTYVQGKPHIGVSLISKESQAQARITAEDLIGK